MCTADDNAVEKVYEDVSEVKRREKVTTSCYLAISKTKQEKRKKTIQKRKKNNR